MADQPDENLELAMWQAIRAVLELDYRKARSREIATIGMKTEDVDYTLTPECVTQYLESHRELEFVSVEKQPQHVGPPLWVFHPN